MTDSSDPFLAAAIAEAEPGLREGGIPIGSVILYRGTINGTGTPRTRNGGTIEASHAGHSDNCNRRRRSQPGTMSKYGAMMCRKPRRQHCGKSFVGEYGKAQQGTGCSVQNGRRYQYALYSRQFGLGVPHAA